uniref:Trafficking protein particle complex subunit 6B n=2 Tax=Onchocerca TaxID=6281 RepID=A0A8R1TXK2_ONCVO
MMNSLISGPCFPFEFLHAEIIRYEKERETEQIEKRNSWIEQMRDNPQMEVSLLDEQLKSVKQVFIQGNAETRLEALGYRVGFVIVEKIAKDLPRMITELERMKFLCKEFWTAAFGRQVDNLRTNHQGVYVIQDNKFFILANFAEGKQYVEVSAIYLAFPCGVIRGALYNLGITSLVTSSMEILPAVKFHVHMQQKS